MKANRLMNQVQIKALWTLVEILDRIRGRLVSYAARKSIRLLNEVEDKACDRTLAVAIVQIENGDWLMPKGWDILGYSVPS